MPSAETLIQIAYAITAATLAALIVYVVLDLRRWARRARDEEGRR